MFRRGLAEAAEGTAGVWGVKRKGELYGRPLRPMFPSVVMELGREVLIRQEGPAVALRPVAEAGKAPALSSVPVGRSGPCVGSRCSAGAETGVASAIGAAAPARATRKVGGKEAQ